MKRPPLVAAVVLCGAAFLGRAEASETGPPATGLSESSSVRSIRDASWFSTTLADSALPHKNTQGFARMFSVYTAPKRKSEGVFDFKPELQVSRSLKLSFSWTGNMIPRDPHATAVSVYGRPW